jgi:hypothetical protein
MRRFVFISIPLLFLATTNLFAAKPYRTYLPDTNHVPKDTTATDSTDDDKNRDFAFGVEYASDQAQHGLHNDIKIPYLEPSFTYTAPKGFYIELSDQYVLPKKIAGFDAFCINPGWNIDLSDNTNLNFNYTRYFFNPNSSNLVRSTLGNSLETYVSQWIGDHLKAKLTIDYDIYKQMGKRSNSPNDFIFTPDLVYKLKWKLGEKTALKIKPEANIDIGTRNFYTQYANAKYAADSAAKKGTQGEKKVASNSNSTFGTLDYNLILTIDLAVGKFDFEPAFNYTDPLYKPSNIPNSPIGYFSFSVVYTISTK